MVEGHFVYLNGETSEELSVESWCGYREVSCKRKAEMVMWREVCMILESS